MNMGNAMFQRKNAIRPSSKTRKDRGVRYLLTIVACSLLLIPQSALAQLPASGMVDFEHPPLLYRGPDPTANQFLPQAVAYTEAESLGPPHIPPSEYLPPSNRVAPDAYRVVPDGYSVVPDAYPGGTIESFMPPQHPYGHQILEPQSFSIREHRDGFFQKLSFTGTWIDRNNKFDDFGVSELDAYVTFAVPLPSREWPLLITPAFNVRYLAGPKNVDLPPRLFETYLDLLWVPQFTPRLTGIFGIAGGNYSDFQTDDNEAWRLSGKALVRYEWIPAEVQILLGVLYLNREDVPILPAGGIIWTPTSDRRYELVFPRPKLAHRIDLGSHYEDWLYLGGEFGGNSYAVQRINGADDSITLRDFRTYVGLERKLDGGAGYRLEIGYVLGRVIEFQSNRPDIEADDTAMIRGGIVF